MASQDIPVNKNPAAPSNTAAAMNRATFLKTLAGGAIAVPTVALANPSTETAIYDLLDAVVDAQFSHDFERLASLMHPASLQMFRKHLSACYDRFLKLCSPEQVALASGLALHPKDTTASDAEFFMFACNSAKERHPDFVGSPQFLPLRIHGCIFDDARFAHVLFSYKGSVHTERTDYAYVAPNVLSVKRDKDEWQIHSCILAGSITTNWWPDFIKNQHRDSEGPGRSLNTSGS